MKRLPVVAIVILFAVLTVVYFRYAIGAPPEALLTHHIATDIYGHFAHVWESLKLLGQGFIPAGDYWVPRGGGYPTAFNDQLWLPQDFALMIAYAIADSYTVALRLVVIASYCATLGMAYWFGTVLLKRRDAGVVLAIAYTFSVYGINQLEHLSLLCIQPLILFTLIFLEKALQDGRLRHTVLTSVGLLLVLLSHSYACYFLLVFIGFRVIFHMLTTRNRVEALHRVTKIGMLAFLALLPFLLLQILRIPSEAFTESSLKQGLIAYTQPPVLYFLRNVPYEAYITETYFMYIGLLVLMLALAPMLLKQHRPAQYVFYLLTAVFFMLYAIGQYGPVNLAMWFHEHMPFAFFIRVSGRALVMGYLGLAVCAAMGFSILVDKIKTRHNLVKPLVTLLVALVIFADLTIGFEPPTMTALPPTEKTYQFLKEQPGNFRIVEVPSIHGQHATTTIYTEHDTISFNLQASGYFEPLYAFADVYCNYVKQSVTAHEAAFYGVKYIAISTDPLYFATYEKALKAVGGPDIAQVRKVESWISTSEDYELVHSEGYTNVYENLQYWGEVFSDETDFLAWSYRDPNTLVIDYSSDVPATITISQSFAEGWTATLDGKVKFPIRSYNSVQQIKVPSGSHSVTLHYQNYERWFIILAACYAILTTVIVWLWRRERTHERN